jgi:hypothetical protein
VKAVYQERPILHIGNPDPKADGLILVFLNGLLCDSDGQTCNAGDYHLENRKKIHWHSRLKIGDKVTVIFESTSGWRRETAVIE